MNKNVPTEFYLVSINNNAFKNLRLRFSNANF